MSKIRALRESCWPVLFLVLSPRLSPIHCKSHQRTNVWSGQASHFHSDVLRRRFQINTMSGMGYQYKGVVDAVRVIIGQEGLRGLYKGIVPNLLKVAPSMASSWLSFEMTRDFLVDLKPEVSQAAL